MQYFQAYFAAYIFRLGLRMLDLEGSLEAGADRQLFGITIMGNLVTCLITLQMSIIAFKPARCSLLMIFFSDVLASAALCYGQLLYGN